MGNRGAVLARHTLFIYLFIYPSNTMGRVQLLNRISLFLSRIIRNNDKIYPRDNCAITEFDSVEVPKIQLNAYLNRFLTYAKLKDEILIVTVILLDRLLTSNRTIKLNSYNCHRLLSTAIVIAAKFGDDFFYNNAFMARVAGLSLEEINQLEICFLKRLKFNVYVNPQLFNLYKLNMGSSTLLESEKPKHSLSTYALQYNPCATVGPEQATFSKVASN